MPWLSAWFENLPRCPSVSRGTPIPAESLRKTKDVGDAISEVASGLLLTAITDAPCGSGG